MATKVFLLSILVHLALGYNNPIPYRTIFFDEPAICWGNADAPWFETRNEHVRKRGIETNIQQKVYDMLQNDIPLTEEEKDQALDSYSYYIPDPLVGHARRVLSGDLRFMHPTGLHLVSWLTGVEYDRLHQLQYYPHKYAISRNVHQLRVDYGDVYNAQQLEIGAWVNGYYGNGTWADHPFTAFSYNLQTADNGTQAEYQLGITFSWASLTVINHTFASDEYPPWASQRAVTANIGTATNPLTVWIQEGFYDQFSAWFDAVPFQFTFTAFAGFDCTNSISTQTFILTQQQASQIPANWGYLITFNFTGLCKCLTISSATPINITMDTLTFGDPYHGGIYFNETSLFDGVGLSSSTPSSWISQYYGEETYPVNQPFSKTRLGIYFHPNNNYNYSDTYKALMIHGFSNNTAFGIDVNRTFFDQFSASFIPLGSYSQGQSITVKVSHLGCLFENSTSDITTTWTLPSTITVGHTYSFNVSLKPSTPYRCVLINWNHNQNQPIVLSQLYFGNATVPATPTPSPTPTPTATPHASSTGTGGFVSPTTTSDSASAFPYSVFIFAALFAAMLF